MMTIDTRRVAAGVCADGHEMQTFDLIIGGRVHGSAATIHGRDIYFQPDAFRRWLEADHDLLHAVGEALVEAQGGRAPGRHLPGKGVRP